MCFILWKQQSATGGNISSLHLSRWRFSIQFMERPDREQKGGIHVNRPCATLIFNVEWERSVFNDFCRGWLATSTPGSFSFCSILFYNLCLPSSCFPCLRRHSQWCPSQFIELICLSPSQVLLAPQRISRVGRAPLLERPLIFDGPESSGQTQSISLCVCAFSGQAGLNSLFEAFRNCWSVCHVRCKWGSMNPVWQQKGRGERGCMSLGNCVT